MRWCYGLLRKLDNCLLNICLEILSLQHSNTIPLSNRKLGLALSMVNDFKGLESCQILLSPCLFKGYTLSILIKMEVTVASELSCELGYSDT